MSPSFTIARIAGIRISANWSWLIVFVLIVWTLESTIFPTSNPGLGTAAYVAMAIAAALLFFTSLLLHELGHALQATREGMEIEGITLWLFGGVARFKGMFPSAGAEFRIAIAGPLVSLVLGVLFVGIALVGGLGSAVDGVAAWLGYINLILLAFNLLPALPLDGGRVFRSLIWMRTGDFTRATRIAADVGRAFGYALIALGLFSFMAQGAWSGAWLAFLGWFLLNAAAAEGRYGLMRDALGDLRVRDLMIRQPESALADWTIAEFVDQVAHVHHFTTYPVVADDHVVGLLPFAAVARVARAQWETTSVGECMVPIGEAPTVREDEPLLDAIGELHEGPLDRALVLAGDQVVGLLSITDVGRLVARHRPAKRRR